MKHLARILAVAVPVIAAAATSALKTPALVNVLEHHPGAAGYVLLVAGLIRAAWKAYTDRVTDVDAAAPAPPHTSMGAK